MTQLNRYKPRRTSPTVVLPGGDHLVREGPLGDRVGHRTSRRIGLVNSLRIRVSRYSSISGAAVDEPFVAPSVSVPRRTGAG